MNYSRVLACILMTIALVIPACIQIAVTPSGNSSLSSGNSGSGAGAEYPFPAEDLTGVLNAIIDDDLDGIPRVIGKTEGKTIVCGFGAIVETPQPQALQARLINSPYIDYQDLQVIEQPSTLLFGKEDAVSTLSESVVSLLDDGKGVFWIGPETQYGLATIGVLMPQEKVGPNTRMEVFYDQTSDGTPLLPAVYPLARGYLDLLAIGDSVMWGNGLHENDKFRNIILEEIEKRTAYRVRQQVYAISGAAIADHPGDGWCEYPCINEVPVALVSLHNQLRWVTDTESIDLVLISGCINDITIGVLLDPDTPISQITDETCQYCHDEMITLLRSVHESMPDAVIAVSAYFPFISQDSEIADVNNWASILGIDLDPSADAQASVDRMVENSALFNSLSKEQIQLAIQEVNELIGEEKIVFVDPGFEAENAVFASDPLLWGLTTQPNISELFDGWDPEIFPEDPLLDYRVEACLGPQVAPEYFWCVYQSIGHPNVPGALRYSERYIEALEEIGFLPIYNVK